MAESLLQDLPRMLNEWNPVRLTMTCSQSYTLYTSRAAECLSNVAYYITLSFRNGEPCAEWEGSAARRNNRLRSYYLWPNCWILRCVQALPKVSIPRLSHDF